MSSRALLVGMSVGVSGVAFMSTLCAEMPRAALRFWTGDGSESIPVPEPVPVVPVSEPNNVIYPNVWQWKRAA